MLPLAEQLVNRLQAMSLLANSHGCSVVSLLLYYPVGFKVGCLIELLHCIFPCSLIASSVLKIKLEIILIT